MSKARPLDGVMVAELGGREAVALCGTLLAQLGASVIVVETTAITRPRDAHRAQFTAGKRSLLASDADQALIDRLMARSDVVITSSDIDRAAGIVDRKDPANVVCDITAFGSTGPLAGLAASDDALQAITGLMDTTGMPDGPPVAIGVPITAYCSAAYAAAGIIAALRVRKRDGIGQRVEVAMYDAGFVAQSNFVMGLLTNRPAKRTRNGNRHPGIAPWNLYATRDGAVLITAGSQAHWRRLCDLMGQPELFEQYGTQGIRLKQVDAVDAAIEAWTRTLLTGDCVARLVQAGVAAGPIAPIDGHPREKNLDHRGMIRTLADPVSGHPLAVPASPLALRGSPPVHPESIPAPDEGRAWIGQHFAAPVTPVTRDVTDPARPLAGIRIVEVAQYTTAPLCSRHLAHLGAEVIKVEKPGGDESRSYEPRAGDRSEAYCMNNADKRSIVLDLQQPQQVEILRALVRSADVLIENNKPGTLARFGLSADDLAALNPRLVYCAISGFGATSLYGDRPGFDTVIQAMSGFMTAVNPGGIALKSGISAADLMGALTGMVTILAALEHRDRTGQGQAIDLSMQDIGCWLTATTWNRDLNAIPRPAMVRCADGYVLVETTVEVLDARLRDTGLSRNALAQSSRHDVTTRLHAMCLAATPVHTVEEACAAPQTKARNLFFPLPADGRDWPMLTLPVGLSRTPARITRQAPGLNADGPAVLAELGLAPSAAPVSRA